MDGYMALKRQVITDLMRSDIPFACVHELIGAAWEVLDFITSPDDGSDDDDGGEKMPKPIAPDWKKLATPEGLTVH